VSSHDVLPVVELGQIPVVCFTHQADVVDIVIPSQTKGMSFGQGESPRLQPSPELPDRLPDDRCEVAVREL
jgi:hypothetical protein